MRVWQAPIMIAILLALDAPASSNSLTILQPGQVGSWTVKGVCKRLVISSEDHKGDCSGEVMLTLGKDGNATLVFSAGQKSLIFLVKRSSARLWQSYKTILDTDRMAFETGGQEINFIPIRGSCDYAAPSSRPGYVNCMGLEKFKMWAATIETDEALPSLANVQP